MYDVEKNPGSLHTQGVNAREANGRWDNPNYTCWMNEDDKKRLARFLSNECGESGVYPWFSSTGRKKPWCE